VAMGLAVVLATAEPAETGAEAIGMDATGFEKSVFGVEVETVGLEAAGLDAAAATTLDTTFEPVVGTVLFPEDPNCAFWQISPETHFL
jgi:hypothetical protein